MTDHEGNETSRSLGNKNNVSLVSSHLNVYCVKNTKKYTSYVNSKVMIKADEQIVSFDISALFISILVDLALDIVDQNVRESHEWELHTRLTQSQIMDLLTYVIKEARLFHV